MPLKKPTTLADEEFNRYFFTESCPKLLQKLSLDDGMKCFLEWKDQYELYLREYEGWCSHYGTNFRGVDMWVRKVSEEPMHRCGGLVSRALT